MAHGSLINRTVVATYARINQVLPWIYSFIYDIDLDEEIITSKSILHEDKEADFEEEIITSKSILHPDKKTITE